MAGSWTADKIAALAPDAGSLKSGRDLGSPRKWSKIGATPELLWGFCQGSGKDPYRTQIDLTEPAFKCSCPSRKFPCKHALGLLFLSDSQPASFTVSSPPDWVSEWVESRKGRAEKRQQKAEAAAAAPPDPAAQAKRIAEREKKVTAGLADLERWLHDLVRQGLAAVQSQPYSFWESTAARMVDAQSPGLARMLRDMGGVPSSGDGWQGRLLQRLARVHVVLEGYKRLPDLAPPTQTDLRTLVGWPQPTEEVLAQPGVADRWLVLGQRLDVEDKLRVQRTWLIGRSTKRPALVLQFAAAMQPMDASLVPGTEFDAELAFYPGNRPLRALVKSRNGAVAPIDPNVGHATIDAAMTDYAAALAAFPWYEQYPLALASVTPVRSQNRWWLRVETGRAIAIAPRFARSWHLLAMSGGRPMWVFGEWDGQHLLPLSAAGETGYVILYTGEAHAAVG